MTPYHQTLIRLLARQAVRERVTAQTPAPCGMPPIRSNRPVQSAAQTK